MSKPAWEYLTTHLPEIRRTVLPNTGRPIGEPGLALLVYLSGQTNKQGEFFMTAKVMQEETDIASLRQVEKLLAGFKALGWITPTGQTVEYMGRGRPTPVYVLTLFPQYADKYTRTLHKSDEIPSGETVEKSSKPNMEKALPKNYWTESEPQPEPEPQPREMGSGEEFDELLRKCIEWELANYPGKAGTGLLRTWRNEYAPIVTRALQDRPTEDLVLWSVELRIPGRAGYQRKPNQPAPLTHLDRPSDFEYPPMDERGRGAPGCPTCGGKGWYLHRENGRLGKSDCTCTTDTTTERVSADLGTNTPVMECPAPADTRSELRGVLQDMTSKYRMPADPY
jgi:hypothetical protein